MAAPHPCEAPDEEHWGKGTTGAEVYGRERPVEVPGLEQMTKPSCATEVSAGEAGSDPAPTEVPGASSPDESLGVKSSGVEVPGVGSPDEALDVGLERRALVVAAPPDEEHWGKGTTGAEVYGRERPVEVPDGEQVTKPSCAVACAGEARSDKPYEAPDDGRGVQVAESRFTQVSGKEVSDETPEGQEVAEPNSDQTAGRDRHVEATSDGRGV